jgi:hypothetical protein
MHRLIGLMRSPVAVGMLICCLASSARAVAISAASDAANLFAPGNDPGWNNVARMSGASAVYLGNRWVITADHVTQAPVRFSDGRVFDASVGSIFRLNNPSATTSPDLRMFRLAEDPGLPSLHIAETTPAGNSIVTMIGAGSDYSPQLIGWSLNARNQWTQILLPFATQLGFATLDTSHMRWGVNRVVDTSFAATSNTFVFSTRFDRQGIPYEAQAVLGDSGGGVFEFVDNTWKLAGIMDTVQGITGQPAKTVVYGDMTFSADLSVYREQIMGLVTRAEPVWQNQVNNFDVNGSGRVNGHDVLLVINDLTHGSFASIPLPGTRPAGDPFFDVDGDYNVTARDVSRLINAILLRVANPSTAQTNVGLVPEPSSAMLALAAAPLAALGLWIRARRKRRRA